MALNLSANSGVRGLVSLFTNLNIIITLGTVDVHRLAVSHDPVRRSLGPFVEETLKPRGKHGDFGWNHSCHVLFALGLETLNDGPEFRSQLFHADRLVLLENTIVDLVADLLALGFCTMLRSPAHS